MNELIGSGIGPASNLQAPLCSRLRNASAASMLIIDGALKSALCVETAGSELELTKQNASQIM